MKKIKYFLYIISICCLSACVDLDVPPMNIVQDDDVYTSVEGIDAIRSRIYSGLPIEDFRYAPFRNVFNDFYILKPLSAVTGEALCRDQTSAATESTGGSVTNSLEAAATFRNIYNQIRDINYFLETLPKYESNFTADQVKHWKGEAYFMRAMAHFALVKRYGGVPYIDVVLNYPQQSLDELQKPRESEEACYDKIGNDFDLAIANLNENSTSSYVNKYTALAFKSRAMLFAGSIAKYNTEAYFDDNNVRLCGIPQSRAVDYFKSAHDAAKQVEGKYSLYTKSWKAGDKEAQYKNYVDMFFDSSSPENIFVKQYLYPSSVHGYDSYYVPRQLMGGNGYSSSNNPTLEFVEMFEGFPKNADGTLKNLDSNGKYILYENTMDLFADAEPRLRATVILPGDVFKGESIEIWRGIYMKSAAGGISPILSNPTDPYPTNDPSILLTSENPSSQKADTLSDGRIITAAGKSGVFNSDRTCAVSGFTVRKYLNPDMPTSLVLENRSDQSWIEMRYAEVLLNRAEAACELADLGEGSQDYLGDAFECINKIRERAGATLLNNKGDLSNNIDIVRYERRKELGFENKTWWDLKRWRIIHLEQDSKAYRTLVPFFSHDAEKFFFDVRPNEYNWRFTFDTRWYYQQIPQGEITASPILKQNPGY